MDLPVRVFGQAGVVDLEAEAVEVVGDNASGSLHTIHANSQSLHPTKEQEGVDGREGVPHRIDRERHFLDTC